MTSCVSAGVLAGVCYSGVVNLAVTLLGLLQALYLYHRAIDLQHRMFVTFFFCGLRRWRRASAVRASHACAFAERPTLPVVVNF